MLVVASERRMEDATRHFVANPDLAALIGVLVSVIGTLNVLIRIWRISQPLAH